MIKRKWNKLKKDPKLFFSDMYAKHYSRIKKYIPIKHDGKFNYTVVSAVYNVEKYLDEYFDSIINQSLNFKKHIHIILVDDGSKDNSAAIIKKWQKKYPNNIHYYYKENGGQASARNLGLQYVKTDWVTFIDPDDFVNVDYFKNIDDVLTKNKQIQSVVCNIQMYRESTKTISDAHPLKYRFPSDVNIVEIDKLGKHINLSAAISFFNMQPIRELEVSFDDKVKPSFEDAKFVADYLLNVKGSVAFLKKSLYFYRKREDGSSTLDKAGQDYKRYTDIYQYGVIPMLQSYHQKYGKVPENIQITALYDFIWQLKLLLNNAEKVAFLTAEQKSHFYALCHQLFEYIDVQQINRFSLADAWFFHKVGMLGQFKKSKPNSQICYVEEVDLAKKQILVAYYTHFDVPSKSMLDNHEIVPAHKKDTANYLNEELFVWEKRMWLPFDDEKQVLSIWIDGALAEIKFGKKATKKAVVADILQAFTSQKYQSDGSWLLMDRETKADDNAEHLYRYLMTHYPEQACYFALNRDSADWDRLADEGFKLVAFGKPEFEHRLTKADKIISSHIDAHIHNYFGDLYAGTKKFVFLQHGVTKDNLSRWLNGKKHVACFVATTKDEYQSIAFGERYKFSEKEVALTGFPRHDELYRKNQNAEESKIILIMPTWRSYLMGETVGKGSNTRTLNPKFLESTYATHWSALLHSDKLKILADKYGYRVVFAPHANIEPYLPQMNLPSYLTIWSASKTTESMQDLFVRASMMITDYSSVAFEMAYIGKPTLYYQFDKNEFFSGSHSYQKGYFEYEQHGFGPVSYDEQTLLNDLADLLKNGVADEYQYRIDNTFAYQDANNCERVYRAIMALDQPETVDNLPILRNMITQAENHQAWDLAYGRIETLLNTNLLNQDDVLDYQNRYLNALFEDKQFSKLLDLLPDYPEHSAYWKAKINLKIGDVVQGAKFFAEHDGVGMQEDLLTALLSASFHHYPAIYQKLLARLSNNLAEQYRPLLVIADELSKQNYFVALALLKKYLGSMDITDKRCLKLELLASYISMRLGNLQGAHQHLVDFEKHTQDDPSCRIAIARLAKLRSDVDKLFAQLNRAFEENLTLIPKDLAVDYLKKMHDNKNIDGETYLLTQFREKYPENQELALYEANKFYQNHNWESVVRILASFVQNSPDATYLYTTALCRLKNHKEAQHYFDSLTVQDSFSYWKLAAEVAEVKKDKALQIECLKKQLVYLE